MIDNKILDLQVKVTGKVIRTRKYDGHFYTVVICPSKDVYAKPSVVEIRSKSSLGSQVDEEIKSVLCEVSGYEAKPYSIVDRETGEQRKVKPVNMYLNLVEI